MLGRSPSTLKPVGWPLTAQREAYSTFVPLEGPVEETWIAAYAVNEKGATTVSRPRLVSGAVVTMAPASSRPPPDESRADTCHMAGVTLGTAPVSTDGRVHVHWNFKRPPCGFTETGILLGSTPSSLARVHTRRSKDSDFYAELPAPPGERVWVAAYVIDMQGYEFRSAPEETLLLPPGREQTYHVSVDNAVSPVFEHKGVI